MNIPFCVTLFPAAALLAGCGGDPNTAVERGLLCREDTDHCRSYNLALSSCAKTLMIRNEETEEVKSTLADCAYREQDDNVVYENQRDIITNKGVEDLIRKARLKNKSDSIEDVDCDDDPFDNGEQAVCEVVFASGAEAHIGATVTGTKGGTVTIEDLAISSSGASADAGVDQTGEQSSSSPVAAEESGTFKQCDPNITARKGTTNCAFASNVFYEYWNSDQAENVRAYSAIAGQYVRLRCAAEDGSVVCRTSDSGVVKFPQTAVDSYSREQAQRYARGHDIGPE